MHLLCALSHIFMPNKQRCSEDATPNKEQIKRCCLHKVIIIFGFLNRKGLLCGYKYAVIFR